MDTIIPSTDVRIRPVVNDKVPYSKLLLNDKGPIGSGAFGAVYRMVHKDWGCQVAYKKLGIQYITDQSQINDLENEADIHRQLRHPNIVSMLGVVFEANNYGLVLEYVCYGSLETFLQQIKAKAVVGRAFEVCWRLKARMSYDVCCGMSYLHTIKPSPVIHGDLKQQNLLVTQHLNIKLSDFGMSKWKDYSRTYTHAGNIQGTPSHIPPEKWINPDFRGNEKCDIYSFGVLAWEIFTEEKAFSNSRNIIRSLVIEGQRPNLDKLPTNVPSQITANIPACWHQEPEKRPTAKELRSTIRDLVEGSDAQSKIEQAVKDVLRIYHRGSSEHGRKMVRVSQMLSEVIRRTDRILTHLRQKRALTSKDYDDIQSQTTVYNFSQRLIHVLDSKPVTAYNYFLDALNQTDQQHLFRLLELGVDINIDHIQVLIDNYDYLKKNLNVNETMLLDHLLQSDVLNEQEMHEIKSKSTPDEKAEQLLHIILRTSQQQYHNFLSALCASGCNFIADQLDIGKQVRQQQQPSFPREQTAQPLSPMASLSVSSSQGEFVSAGITSKQVEQRSASQALTSATFIQNRRENISLQEEGERIPTAATLREKVNQLFESNRFEEPLVWKTLLIWARGLGNSIREKKKVLYDRKEGDNPNIIQGILLSACNRNGETDTLSGKKIEQQINLALVVAMMELEHMMINGKITSEIGEVLRAWFGQAVEWHFQRLGGAMTSISVENNEKSQSFPMIFFDWRNDSRVFTVKYGEVRYDTDIGEAFVYPYQTETMSPEKMRLVDYLVIAYAQEMVDQIRALLSKYPQAKIYYANKYDARQDEKKDFKSPSGTYVQCSTRDGGNTIVAKHNFMQVGIQEQNLSAQNMFLTARRLVEERGVRAELCKYKYPRRGSGREFSHDAAIVEYSDE